MTAVEYQSDFELTKYTPYLALMGELWGICCEDLGDWLYYHSVKKITKHNTSFLLVQQIKKT